MESAASPTTDISRARQDLATYGVAILRDVLTPEKTAEVRRRLYAAIPVSEADEVGTRGFAFDPDDHNIRVWHLLNLDPVFVELTRHPVALDFVRHLLGPDFMVSNCSANITEPGNQPMTMHADQGYVLPPWPDRPLACVVAWLLDDMTEQNGGTRYVPGSHHRSHNPDPKQRYDTVGVVAPAGSIAVMDGRLWHQTGANSTRDTRRAAILPYYTLRWLRPQVNWNAALWPQTVAQLDEAFLHLLGYFTGNAEFHIPSGKRAQARPSAALDSGERAFKLRPNEAGRDVMATPRAPSK